MHTARRQRGFTLIEILFTMAVIFLLMGLLLGGIRHIMKNVKSTADLATVNALKDDVAHFAQITGFNPPLVMDLGPYPAFTNGPLVTVSGEQRVRVYTVINDAAFLRTAPVGGATPLIDMRFSMYSLPYYLMGVLDLPRSATNASPIDGLAGPGTRMPKRDGTFEVAGRTLPAFFDPRGHQETIVTTDAANGKIEFRDSHGVAYRYYHWIRGDSSGAVGSERDLHIPWILGTSPMDQDPAAQIWTIREELRNADYAIVCAGPNGVFGDEDLIKAAYPSHPQGMSASDMLIKLGRPGNGPLTPDDRAAAMADNIVVVGVEPHR
jgi:prepilin-type N-terminal cleavage/methylation domain-containing protein